VLAMMTSTYLLAALITPLFNKIRSADLITNLASFSMVFIFMLIWFPFILSEVPDLNISFINFHVWAIIPIAVYHYSSIKELASLSDSIGKALLPYALGAVAGVILEFYYPEISHVIATAAIGLTIIFSHTGFGTVSSTHKKNEVEQVVGDKSE
jgi:hypothetical protein